MYTALRSRGSMTYPVKVVDSRDGRKVDDELGSFTVYGFSPQYTRELKCLFCMPTDEDGILEAAHMLVSRRSRLDRPSSVPRVIRELTSWGYAFLALPVHSVYP